MFIVGKTALQRIFQLIKAQIAGKADKKYVDDKLQDMGNISFATFNVVDGNLIMENDSGKTHTDFRVEAGNLIVEVNG